MHEARLTGRAGNLFDYEKALLIVQGLLHFVRNDLPRSELRSTNHHRHCGELNSKSNLPSI